MVEWCWRAEDVSRETLESEFSHFQALIEEGTLQEPVQHYPLLDKQQFRLYPVVDSVWWIEMLLKIGVKTVQLRIKDTNHPELESQIKKAIELGEEYNAQVFINDYWHLAVKHGAYGVHLGQEDLDTADLNQIYTAGLRLGVSTHGYEEILRAISIGPSYIALGHVFPTPTKQMPSEPQGLKRLAYYQRFIDAVNRIWNTDMPTVAIGGIDLNNAPEVLRCEVDSLAVVRAITLADDTEQAVQNFMQLFTQRFGGDKNDAC
ncbi:thiamine phosphate synthase [Vibrio sp. HA2012]|uniref:thiamine phosphate synthase n=1 Tax=Vibrio sp. HA2012 TaxID=1971595 RepID=UPI000C2B7F4D|nr:thiamine phosphate synthase [Vibrio sp. HA2012]